MKLVTHLRETAEAAVLRRNHYWSPRNLRFYCDSQPFSGWKGGRKGNGRRNPSSFDEKGSRVLNCPISWLETYLNGSARFPVIVSNIKAFKSMTDFKRGSPLRRASAKRHRCCTIAKIGSFSCRDNRHFVECCTGSWGGEQILLYFSLIPQGL